MGRHVSANRLHLFLPPLQERIETVADESELDEIHDTERNLFYVACTRARDRLLVSGVQPASEFFADFSARRA